MASRIRTCINLFSIAISLFIVVVAGWLWLRWPASTARQFIDDCRSASLTLGEIPGIQSRESDVESFRSELQRSRESVSIEPNDGTLMERLLGRQRFSISIQRGRYDLVVERGTIIEGPTLEYNIGHVLILDVL